MFQSKTGKFQENVNENGFYTLIKSYIKLKAFPYINHHHIDMSYVDYLSKAIILLFNKTNLSNETYNLYNNKRVSLIEIAEYLSKSYKKLTIKPFSEFFNYLYNNYENEELKKCIVDILVHSHFLEKSSEDTEFLVVCDKTESILNRLGFYWPELTQNHIDNMVTYCKEIGFF